MLFKLVFQEGRAPPTPAELYDKRHRDLMMLYFELQLPEPYPRFDPNFDKAPSPWFSAPPPARPSSAQQASSNNVFSGTQLSSSSLASSARLAASPQQQSAFEREGDDGDMLELFGGAVKATLAPSSGSKAASQLSSSVDSSAPAGSPASSLFQNGQPSQNNVQAPSSSAAAAAPSQPSVVPNRSSWLQRFGHSDDGDDDPGADDDDDMDTPIRSMARKKQTQPGQATFASSISAGMSSVSSVLSESDQLDVIVSRARKGGGSSSGISNGGKSSSAAGFSQAGPVHMSSMQPSQPLVSPALTSRLQHYQPQPATSTGFLQQSPSQSTLPQKPHGQMTFSAAAAPPTSNSLSSSAASAAAGIGIGGSAMSFASLVGSGAPATSAGASAVTNTSTGAVLRPFVSQMNSNNNSFSQLDPSARQKFSNSNSGSSSSGVLTFASGAPGNASIGTGSNEFAPTGHMTFSSSSQVAASFSSGSTSSATAAALAGVKRPAATNSGHYGLGPTSGASSYFAVASGPGSLNTTSSLSAMHMLHMPATNVRGAAVPPTTAGWVTSSSGMDSVGSNMEGGGGKPAAKRVRTTKTAGSGSGSAGASASPAMTGGANTASVGGGADVVDPSFESHPWIDPIYSGFSKAKWVREGVGSRWEFMSSAGAAGGRAAMVKQTLQSLMRCASNLGATREALGLFLASLKPAAPTPTTSSSAAAAGSGTAAQGPRVGVITVAVALVGNKANPSQVVAAVFAVRRRQLAAGGNVTESSTHFLLPLTSSQLMVESDRNAGHSALPADYDVSCDPVHSADGATVAADQHSPPTRPERWRALAAVMSARGVPKLMYDAKASLYALLRCPLTSETQFCDLWDPLIAAYLLNPDVVGTGTMLPPPWAQCLRGSAGGAPIIGPDGRSYTTSLGADVTAAGSGAGAGAGGISLAAIAAAYRVPTPHLPTNLGAIPPVITHLALLSATCGALSKEISAAGMQPVFEQQEMRLVPALAAIEATGMAYSPQAFASVSRQIDAACTALQEEANRLAGTEFLLSSPKQVAEVRAILDGTH